MRYLLRSVSENKNVNSETEQDDRRLYKQSWVIQRRLENGSILRRTLMTAEGDDCPERT